MERSTGIILLKRLNNGVERGILIVGTALFAVFVAVVFLQVVSRNYLRISMLWIQEVALFCFIWSVFLGGSVAVRQRQHYIVEIFPDRFVRVNQLLNLFADLCLFGLVYILLPVGIQFAQLGMNRYSRVLQLPQALFFAAFPVAGACILLFGIEIVADDIRRLRTWRAAE